MCNSIVRGVVAVLALGVGFAGGCDGGALFDDGSWGCGNGYCEFEETCSTCPADCNCTLGDVHWDTLTGTVAFIRGFGFDRNPAVGVLHAATRQTTVLPTLDGAGISEGSVALSPDGGRIAYAAYAYRYPGYQVFVMNIDGTDAHLVASSSRGHCLAPSWSPDGTEIVYLAGSSGQGQLVSVRPDGTHKTFLPIFAYNHVAFSPSGDRLAISSSRDGISEGIAIVARDGTPIAQVPSGGDGLLEFSPTWSPDGSHVAFIAMHGPNEVGGLPYYFDVVLVEADGTGRTVVIHWPFEGYPNMPYVVFSPDGTRLMFDGSRTESAVDLYTIAPDGSGLAQVTTDGAISPSWSR